MSPWICKLIGAAAVGAFAWLLQRTVCDEPKGATEQLSGYLALFGALRRGIAYDRAPLDQLLARCDSATLAACMGRETATRVDSLAALADGSVFLVEGLEAIVREAARCLGRGYQEEQLGACDKYIASLTALAAAHQKKIEERKGMLGTLIYTAAAALILLLL